MSSSSDPLQSRILIVDDQESNVRLLELALRRGGYLATTSTTQPVDVCGLHRQNHYDLILLDLQMPRMDGYEVLAALAAEPAVPVLVLSADPSQENPSMKAGAACFLAKPFVLAEVLRHVTQILSTKVEELTTASAAVTAASSQSSGL